MLKYRTSRRFDVIFVMSLTALLLVGYANRIAVTDWFFFRSYQPSSVTIQTAADAGLNSYGRYLLYRTNPTFAQADVINKNCDVEKLGCLDEKGNAFILDITETRDQAVVTAAHEMLHLAYRRLPKVVKEELASQIDLAIETNAKVIDDELEGQTSIEDRREEAHALLGTEYSVLPEKLEQYYSQYFSNRADVVAAARRSQP